MAPVRPPGMPKTNSMPACSSTRAIASGTETCESRSRFAMSQPFLEEMDTDGGRPYPSTQFLLRVPPGCMALPQGHHIALPDGCNIVLRSLGHYTTSMASTVGPARHNDNEILRGGYNQTSIAATGLPPP